MKTLKFETQIDFIQYLILNCIPFSVGRDSRTVTVLDKFKVQDRTYSTHHVSNIAYFQLMDMDYQSMDFVEFMEGKWKIKIECYGPKGSPEYVDSEGFIKVTETFID